MSRSKAGRLIRGRDMIYKREEHMKDRVGQKEVVCFLEKRKRNKVSLVYCTRYQKRGRVGAPSQFKELRIFFFNLHIKKNGKPQRAFKHDLICSS